MTITTVASGPFNMVENINRGPVIWTPDASAVVGSTIPLDGSDLFKPTKYATNSQTAEVIYDDIDSTRVIRAVKSDADLFHSIELAPSREQIPGYLSPGMQVEATVKVGDGGFVNFAMSSPAIFMYVGSGSSGNFFMYGYGASHDDGTLVYSSFPTFDDTGLIAGWYVFGLRLNIDQTISARVQPDSDDEEWHDMSFFGWEVMPDDFLDFRWNLAAGGNLTTSTGAISRVEVGVS